MQSDMSQLDVNQSFDLFGQFWQSGEEEKRTPAPLPRWSCSTQYVSVT
jgi:hypothetical protein